MPRNLNFCFTISSPPSDPPSQINHSRPSTHSQLIKNFNSLYDPTTTTTNAVATTTSDHHSTLDSHTETAAEPNFATAFASHRFFFSSPGRSNSIIDSSISSSSVASTSSSSSVLNDVVSGDSIAVHTESPDPFLDFRRSMQEMVEARELHDVAQSWDYLHELLMCYLSLNPKSTHKFIVGAFADLLITLMTEKGRRKTPFSGEI